ncbi:DUF6053 domain-containing protein [Lysobacter sp. TAB13]
MIAAAGPAFAPVLHGFENPPTVRGRGFFVGGPSGPMLFFQVAAI